MIVSPLYLRLITLLFLTVLASLLSEAFAKPANKLTQQIFKYEARPAISRLLGAEGVAGYVISANGSNRGLVIIATETGGLAEHIGLIPGDVLLNLNDKSVTSSSQADHILSQAPSGILHAVFVRQGEQALDLYNQTVQFLNGGSLRIPRSASLMGNQSKASIPSLENYVLSMINADRQKNGVRPVASSPALCSLARAYAEDMSRRAFKGHIDPEGRNPNQRAQAAGIKVGVSENIAWCFGKPTMEDNASTCEANMMNEPANDPANHRGNILNPNHVVVGVGVTISTGNEIIIVQEFANREP
jgi:uncharacterized protein YkwD